jgi:hypothetical protein
MRIDGEERRRSGRWAPGPHTTCSRVRLREGRELAVVNVSTTGALVEGTTWLLPGTHFEVHVTAAQGRVLVRSSRALYGLDCDRRRHHVSGGLAFTAPVDLPPVEVASHHPALSASGGACLDDVDRIRFALAPASVQTQV